MQKRVLLVEDDVSVSEELGRALGQAHHDVGIAQTEERAVSKFMHERPDLVLLDLDLPGVNGWHAFERMEQVRPFMPIIVITSRWEEFEHANEYGVDALMEKPLYLPLLIQTIETLIIEPESVRIARITDRSFKTQLLFHKDDRAVEGHKLSREFREWGINE